MSKQPSQLLSGEAPSPPAEAHTHALTPLLQRPLHGGSADVPNGVIQGVTNETAQKAAHAVIQGVIIGRVAAMTEAGVLVRIPGMGERVARTLCALPEDAIERECAVLFENGDLTRPLVMGLLLSMQHVSAADGVAETTSEIAPELASASTPERELRIDGERLVIRADTELELRCGESVILLQRDGRIEIRGNYITSQATATQRLRGGSIHMN